MRTRTIRALLLAAVVAGSGVANHAAGATVSWLSTSLATVTKDPATAALHPAWCCGGTLQTRWSYMEVSNAFDLTGITAMLAVQKSNGMQNVILKIGSPPPDVNASNYVDRIKRLVAHMAALFSTANDGLWILPDNEPPISRAGFDRHAAILQACFQASHGRIKIVGCSLQGVVPKWFAELAKRGCAQWCDAIDFHYYGLWASAPDVPWHNDGTGRTTLYDDLGAIRAMLPGKPFLCDEFGLCPSADRNEKTVLEMLAAGVNVIQPYLFEQDMTVPGDDMSQYHGIYPYMFYRGWDKLNNRPAPYAQCVLDLAHQIGSNPKASLTRSPDGRHVVSFTNGVTYTWNANRVAPIQRTTTP